MKILVTGGAGFIGSALVKKLLKGGHAVTVYDTEYSSRYDTLLQGCGMSLEEKRLLLIQASITDTKSLYLACAGQDLIYHLAALKSVPESVKQPITYNIVNIDGTLNVLEAAKNQNVSKVIFASSSAIYGDLETNVPILETMKPRPSSPYAVTKLAGEAYCRSYSYNHGIKTVALRFFNIYGPGQDVNDGYAGVISKFISAILQGKKPLVYGDGRQTRDFIYIDDVVSALIAAKEPHNMKDFEEFNIGSGKGQTLLQLIRTINQQLGLQVEPEFLAPQSGDIKASVAETHKAEMYLGWKPGTGFSEGIAKTIKYFQEKVNV